MRKVAYSFGNKRIDDHDITVRAIPLPKIFTNNKIKNFLLDLVFHMELLNDVLDIAYINAHTRYVDSQNDQKAFPFLLTGLSKEGKSRLFHTSINIFTLPYYFCREQER